MWVRARARWLPKAGNSPDEYEDAFWPENACREARLFRAAIADGATETSFSGLWAHLLASAYARGRLSTRHWERSLAPLQQRWWSEAGRAPLPWYAEEKMRQGAFSSFLGLTIDGRTDGRLRWHAVAIGDSCLFQVRAGALLVAFPLGRASEFGSRPYLLSTDAARNRHLSTHTDRIAGEAQVGDTFYLLTDALAAWFLAEHEFGGKPWKDLDVHATDADFECWLGSLRAGQQLRNDDTTAFTVHLPLPDLADVLADPARL